MYIHNQKTSCTIVDTKQRLDGSHLLNMKADNINIEQISSQKLLGLYIDKNINWSIHIAQLCAAVTSQNIFTVTTIGICSTHVPELFHQGYILPLLTMALLLGGLCLLV